MKKAIGIGLVLVFIIVLIWALDTYGAEINGLFGTKHSGKIPEGAVYSVYDAKANKHSDIHGGEEFPKELNHMDFYTYEGLTYIYSIKIHSWVYTAYDGVPENVLKEINKVPVKIEEINKDKGKLPGLGSAADITVKDAEDITYNTVS